MSESLIVKLEAEIAQYESKMATAQKVLEQLKSSTITLNEAQKELEKTTDQVSSSVLDYDVAMKRAEKVVTSVLTATERYSLKMAELNQLLAEGYISQDAFSRAAKKANEELQKSKVKENSEKLKEFNARMKEHDALMKSGEAVRQSVLKSTEKYADQLNRLNQLLAGGAVSQETYNRALKKLNDEFGMGLNNKLAKLGENLTAFGKKLTLALTVPIVGFGTLAVLEFGKFDQAMTRTQAILGVTKDSVAALRKQVLNLSASGEVLQGPTELAKGLEALGRATRDVDQSLQLLPQAAQFATVAELGLMEATDHLTTVQKAVGLASENAAENMKNFARVSDVLVGATTISQLSVRQLSDSLTSLAGETLRQFNKTIEEGTAVLIEFGRQGFTNARSGTMLSRIMLQLSKASRDAAESHKIFNLQVYDSEGQMNNLGDIVKQLTMITAGMTGEMTSATLELLGFDQITQRALIPLLGFGDAIKKNQQELEKMGGVTKRLSDDVMESFNNRIEVMKNRLTVLGIETAQSLIPVLESMIGLIGGALDWFNSLDAGAKELIGTFTLLAAAIGPLLVGLGVMITVYSNLVIAIEAGTGAMIGATVAAKALQVAIYSLATLGIAALILGISTLLEKFIEWITGLKDLRIEQEKLVAFNEKLADSNKKVAAEELNRVKGIDNIKDRIKATEELIAVQEKQKAINEKRAAEFSEELQRTLDAVQNQPQRGLNVPKTVDEAVKQYDESGILKKSGTIDERILPLTPDQIGINRINELVAGYKEAATNAEIANQALKDSKKLIEEANTELKNREKIEAERIKQLEEGQKKIDEAMNAAKVAKEQEEILKNAEKAFNKHQEELRRAGEQIRKSLLSPVEEYAETVDKLAKLRFAGIISPETEKAAAEMAAEKANKELNKEHNKLLERRAQLLDKTLTPQEKYQKQLEEANDLWDKGILNVGDYNRIVQNAFEEMQGKADIDVRFHTSGLDGVEAQSAEAFSRIRATLSLGENQLSTKSRDLKKPRTDVDAWGNPLSGGAFTLPQWLKHEGRTFDSLYNSTGPKRTPSGFQTTGSQPKEVKDMVDELKKATEQREMTNELLKALLENTPNYIPADIT